MSLYATMFDQHDITTSQLLVTSFDFASPERCQTLRNVMEQILHLGIVPLLNENDAVSGNQGSVAVVLLLLSPLCSYELFGNTFSDNDSLAAIVAGGIEAQVER
jgi:glutamate 5-kinase